VNRVTLDTNIYVSAFEFGGIPMRLLQMGVDGEIEIAVSQLSHRRDVAGPSLRPRCGHHGVLKDSRSRWRRCGGMIPAAMENRTITNHFRLVPL